MSATPHAYTARMTQTPEPTTYELAREKFNGSAAQIIALLAEQGRDAEDIIGTYGLGLLAAGLAHPEWAQAWIKATTTHPPSHEESLTIIRAFPIEATS